MHGQKRDDSEITGRYPHYVDYKNCQKQALLSGSATLFVSGICLYVFAEQLYRKFKPDFSRNWLIAGPMLGGSAIAFMVTWRRSKNCVNMWMAMEDKHSILSPID